MNLKEVIEIMDIATGIITGVATPIILAFIYFISRMVKRDRGAHKKLTDAIIDVQRTYFVQVYYEAKRNGGIKLYERRSLNEMYKSYTDLEANSFISDIMEEIKDMPTLTD